FVVVLVNALVLLGLERLRLGRRVAAAGMGAVALAAVMLPGLIRIPAPDGRRIDVAIVQGNDHEVPLADPRLEDLTIARNHARLQRALASDPPDLGVW